jgi:hypothetical protein
VLTLRSGELVQAETSGAGDPPAQMAEDSSQQAEATEEQSATAEERIAFAESLPAAISPALARAVGKPAKMRIALAEDIPAEAVPVSEDSGALPPASEGLAAEDEDALRAIVEEDTEIAAAPSADPPTGALPDDDWVGDQDEASMPSSASDLEAAMPSPWAEQDTECPRDWVAAEAVEGIDSADCQALAALLPTLSSDDQGALGEAVTDHAMKLGLMAPRVPMPRPDPPRRARVKVSRASDWPAEPPPNCGNLHAYWRFTDRKTGAKEWYCK